MRRAASARARVATERELGEDRDARKALVVELSAGGEHATGEREIEPGAALLQVRRSQARGDATAGETVAGVQDRRADAFASAAHPGLSEPHDREAREPLAQIDLDLDVARRNAVDGKAVGPGEHGTSVIGAGDDDRRPGAGVAGAQQSWC
jgi:hypothetical protein